MNRIRKVALTLMSLAVVAGVTVGYTMPAFAQDPKAQVCNGIAMTGGGGCGGADGQITKVVQLAINLLSLIGGIAAVIMIIVSGLRLITSNGSSDGLASARNGIIYSVIGLIVIALAQVIVRFVLGRL